ncbi:type ISP restriction/modification enzyme, partial [Nocardia farcinica]|uniref:type ISP restriction/modification enzyme n=1 Tax=Nocardia farcinica TaxID=37329 RepID=UPI002B4B3519
FQITENGDSLDSMIFPQNNERILRQNDTPINVVIGNPPYSVGQNSANDLNANISYPTLDKRIADTYAAHSTATNKNSLYDSYLRAFRWATDRIGNKGIVAFVSNGGWLDGNTADGIRLSLADEYSRIYAYNLRGNARTAGELRKKEAGNVFGSGARTTIGIWIGIKNPDHTGPCQIYYRDIGDYLTREDKLRIIAEGTLTSIDWQTITPNTHGDWANQRNDEYQAWPAIGEKNASREQVTVFSNFSRGLETTRDAWVYNYSHTNLATNVQRLIGNYNDQHTPFADYCRTTGVTRPNEAAVTDYLTANPTAAQADHIKWSRSLRTHLARRTQVTYRTEGHTVSLYRPFAKQHTYFDKHLNHERSQLPSMFPTPHHKNIGFYVVGTGSDKPFSVLMLNMLPDLHVTGAGSGGQFFPRWTYEKVVTPEGELDFGAATSSDIDDYGFRRID